MHVQCTRTVEIAMFCCEQSLSLDAASVSAVAHPLRRAILETLVRVHATLEGLTQFGLFPLNRRCE